MYQGSIREEAAHLAAHLSAEVATATGADLVLLNRLLVSAQALTTVTSPQLTDLVAWTLIRTAPEDAWGKAFRVLFGARTRADAETLFDALLAQFDTPGVRLRLGILKDVLVSRGL